MKTIGLPGKDLLLKLSLGLSAIKHRLYAAGVVGNRSPQLSTLNQQPLAALQQCEGGSTNQ